MARRSKASDPTTRVAADAVALPDHPGTGPGQRFLRSAALTYGSNLAAAGLSLGNVLITSRALGPAGRGEITLLTTIAILTSSASVLGVQEANINIAGLQPETRRALASNSAVLSFIAGGLGAAVIALLVWQVPAATGNVPHSLILLILAALPMLVAQTFFQLLVQADYGFAATNIAWLLGPTLNVTVNGILAATGHLTVAAAVITWVTGQALGTLVLAGHLILRGAGFGSVDVALARRSLAFGLKTHFGRVMMLGNYRLDQWILGAVAGSHELGLYSVAVAWAEALFYLPTTLVTVQRPDLVRLPRVEAARQAAATFRSAFVLTLPVAFVLFLAAPLLCAGLFGEAFRRSAVDLRILAFGAFGILALKQLGNALTAQNWPLQSTAAVGLALVATVVLDVLLIPSHGAVGAAAASTAAYSVGGFAIAAIFARRFELGIAQLVPRPGDVASLWAAGRRVAVELRAR